MRAKVIVSHHFHSKLFGQKCIVVWIICRYLSRIISEGPAGAVNCAIYFRTNKREFVCWPTSWCGAVCVQLHVFHTQFELLCFNKPALIASLFALNCTKCNYNRANPTTTRVQILRRNCREIFHPTWHDLTSIYMATHASIVLSSYHHLFYNEYGTNCNFSFHQQWRKKRMRRLKRKRRKMRARSK